MLERAPLDLRVNRLKADRDEALRRLPEADADAAFADRAPPAGRHRRSRQSAAWRAGLVEVQDEGSQLLCLACGARARQ